MANFVGDQQMLQVFGTQTIPTPFRSATKFEEVRAAVQYGNPTADVVLIGPPF